MKHKTALLLFVESSLFLQWVNIAHRSMAKKSGMRKMKKMSALFIKLSANNTQPANKQQNELLLTWIYNVCRKRRAKLLCRNKERKKYNQSWHDGKMSKNLKTVSFEQRKERVGETEAAQKRQTIYSASPAAKTMTTTTSSLFF